MADTPRTARCTIHYTNRIAPIKPRNGHTLIVGIVARISGCGKQQELSNDDQVDHAKQVVQEMYKGPIDYRIVATTGKGENLDRPELDQIEAELRSRELDLLMVEDLGRLVRGTEAVRLLGIGVDHGTRFISPNDCIDTAESNWEEEAISACAEHVGHNAHTSKRLKFKLMNRFIKFGGATARPIYGYIVPPGAKTYHDWQKDPEATEIVRRGMALLRETLNYAVVADWFNENNISTGPYCRVKKWDGPMVRRFYHNSLLKGMPGRGFRRTEKHHESGKRRSVKSDSPANYRDCPHLAHVDGAELDELLATLDARNASYKRRSVAGVDPLLNVPKRRTRFPGQWGRCWYCGHRHVWHGNGMKNHLICTAAREWGCWNSVSYDGDLATQRVVQAIMDRLGSLEGFDDQFRELVRHAHEGAGDDHQQQAKEIEVRAEVLRREKDNLLCAIRSCGAVPMLQEELDRIASAERQLDADRAKVQRVGKRPLVLPGSVAEFRGLIESELRKLAAHSPECAGLLRKLVPEFYVYLVRLCDGGHLLPRAVATIALDGIVPGTRVSGQLSGLLTGRVTLDLFEPPQRERIRVEAVRLRQSGMGPKAIATRIAERPSSTAVQNALALHDCMTARGLVSPYVVIDEVPADYKKLRRYKHARYEFSPCVGYQRPPLEPCE